MAAAVLISCSRSKTYHLPNADTDPEIAFGVLYDAGDRVSLIGPVVLRQSLPGYTFESKDDTLKPRLFEMKIADLKSSAGAACAMLTTRVEQAACEDRAAACTMDPISCLKVVKAQEDCGDRLPLPRPAALKAFAPDDKGDLLPVADPGPPAAQLELCGPTIRGACPLGRAGFAVTEQGAFRCLAPSRQLECRLEIDLGDCGLGTIQGTLGSDGVLSGHTSASGCTVERSMAGDLAPGTTGFAVVCGDHRFVAVSMETIFGEVPCPRHGPGAFEQARFGENGSPATNGAILGFKAFQPAGWLSRYLILGTGYDQCAENGCYRSQRPFNCAMCCADCMLDNLLDDCLDDRAWPACVQDFPQAACAIAVGSARSLSCIERCTRFCNAAAPNCEARASGHVLVITSTEAPERDLVRIPLGSLPVTQLPATAHQAIAVLGAAERPAIAVAGLGGVRLFVPGAADALTESPSSLALPSGFRVAGLAALPGQSDLVIFGATGDVSPKGALAFAHLDSGPLPSLAIARTVSIAELQGVDAVAFAGPGGAVVIAVSWSAPLGSAPGGMVAARTIDGTGSPGPIALAGRPTALGPLPGGGFLVGVDLGGSASEVDLFPAPGASPIKLPLLGGLRVTAAALDGAGCAASSDVCRVFLGLQETGDVADRGNALVGLVEYHPGTPAMSRLVPALLKTGGPELTALEYDSIQHQLVAVSSTQNQITKIMLVR